MNKYSQYTPDQLEELFSNYLIDSWSYSKVSTFARNEKDFERSYIYCETGKRSISSVAGNAYHEALRVFFQNYNTLKEEQSLTDLTQVAYNYLDEIDANAWRLTDKFQTVEQAQAEATRLVTALLTNFYSEKSIYCDNIDTVLDVETKTETWVTVNGVDIPLPLHFIVDLAIRTKDGKTVIIDHKSKSAYTAQDELVLVHGQQAITYVLGYESVNVGSHVDEVWFIENKASQNRDKSEQCKLFRLIMDEDSRRLHEYYLYQPLRRMIEAVSDPDYIYTINNADNLADKAELYEFSARTIIAEVDDFVNIPETKKPLIQQRLRKIKDSSLANITPKVITAFRKSAASFITFDYSHSNMTNSEKIEHLFRTFSKQVQVAHTIEGYSCDTYLCEVAAGVQLGKLGNYTKDIAYALDVPSVRINQTLVMYEGKSYLSIEVNKKRTETLVWDSKLVNGHLLPVGLDNFRKPVIWNLDNQSTPHMLVCGATGSGKSVMLRSTIKYAEVAGIRNIVILDPKYEFTGMANSNIKVYNDIEDIELYLNLQVLEMQKRVKEGYSELTLVVFDEFADAQDQSKELHRGKKMDNDVMPMETSFKMLLQKGRSCGYRFIAATQRADTKTISGTTKVNFPVQVCFRVPKAIDSKVVIDEEGANTLAGGGDGLIKSPEYLDQVVRFQGFFYNN